MGAVLTRSRSIVKGARRVAAFCWVPAALMAAWQSWIWLADVPRIVAPSPLDVAKEFVHPGWLLDPLLATCWVTMVGVVLGLVFGATLAVACWWFSPARMMILPPAVLSLIIPLVVFIPILGRLFGFGTPSVIAIGGIVGFFPSLVFVDSGMSSVPRSRREMAQVFGASRSRYLMQVALPTSIPRLAVAVRLTASFALLGTVTAEYLVGSGGLGRLIANTQFFLRTSRSWAIAWVIIAASTALYCCAGALERWAHERFEVAEE